LHETPLAEETDIPAGVFNVVVSNAKEVGAALSADPLGRMQLWPDITHADVDPDSQVAQEEIFGPVLTVTPYDTDDEAVAIANNTIYGLSGEVSSADVDRAFEVAKRMRTGNVTINGKSHFGIGSPFGGTKDWELYRSVFTADAYIDYSSAGAAAGSRDEVAGWRRLLPPRTGPHARGVAEPSSPRGERLVRQLAAGAPEPHN
jgi:acyl-CoA reductase-like NAD-dependent aldehyde dehydrogenase